MELSELYGGSHKSSKNTYIPNETSDVGGDRSSRPAYEPILTVHDRLYADSTALHDPKVEKDVLITTLSTDTIRWIKRRRVMEAKHRVAITHFREGQLREIFDGLDFDSTGIIDLAELKNAVQYAEDELKGKKGPSFKDVAKMFDAMDEDGNGEVDYHEFMISMTGSSKSFIDQASEQDVEKLRAKFKEYAIKKKREYFVKAIDDKPVVGSNIAPGRHTPAPPTLNPTGSIESLANQGLSDGEKCKYFTSLFRIGGSGSTPSKDLLKPQVTHSESDTDHHIPHPGSTIAHLNTHADRETANSRSSMHSPKSDTSGMAESRASSPLHHHAHSSHSHHRERHERPATHLQPNSPERIEQILEPFAKIDKASREQNRNPTDKEFFYYQLEDRIKQERRQAYADIHMDPEARDTESRVLHEKE